MGSNDETETKFEVKLRVYDLSHGMAATMSQAILGKRIELLPHTGLEVYGVEYFFGGGIVKMPPWEVEQTFGMKPVRVETLGTTEIPQAVFHSYLDEISPEWTQEKYDLLHRNCNNFTDEVSKFLIGEGIPEWIVGIPEEVLNTPLGAQLAPLFSGVQQQVQAHFAQTGQQSLWTQGGGGAAAPAPPAATAPAPRPAPQTQTAPPAAVSTAPTQPVKAVAPGLASVDEQLKKIQQGPGDKEAKITCLDTVAKLCQNLLNNPKEMKFRTVKTDNPAIQKKVGSISSGFPLLQAVGFVPESSASSVLRFGSKDESASADLSGPQLDSLSRCVTKLRDAIEFVKNPNRPTPTPPAARQTNPAGAMPGGGMPGGAGGMQRAMEQMMQNPQAMAQQMQTNPMLRQMAEANPQMAQMMQNPAMMQQAMQMMQQNPQMMQQAMQMAQGGGMPGGMGGGMPGMPGGMGGMGGAPPQATQTAAAGGGAGDAQFAGQLESLAAMGLTDRQRNLQALRQAGGNVERAIEILMTQSG